MSPSEQAVESARTAGLKYVSDNRPGIRRRNRAGNKFRYINADGTPVRNEPDLARIRSLAIPPAWQDVWICPDARGHLQATGRDAKGRKQYRYHPKWRETRDETKYHRMIAFGKALPAIRRKVTADLKRKGLPREKVLATIVRLLETTLIRVGNEEYAASNRSYGLTTLQDRHARISNRQATLSFRGKSGRDHTIKIDDPRLAKIVKSCRDLPGQELFQYRDRDGTVTDVTSTDVNDYLRQITGDDFTAKDFRTWAGTVLATIALRELDSFESPTHAKRNLKSAIERVAGQLGNTPAICRRCYIHPIVLDTYLDGTLVERLQRQAEEKLTNHLSKLRPDEAAVLALLHENL